VNVLLALDGTADGEPAAAAISEWVRASGATVRLLSVLRPSHVKDTPDAGHFAHTVTPLGTASGQVLPGLKAPTARTAEDRTQALARATAERADYLDLVAEKYFEGVQTEKLVLDASDVAAAIVEEAGKPETNLVVMATRSRSPLGQALFGAVHEQVVRNAPVPVLLVGPGAQRLQASVDVSG
jgi:nucleotide-binding universal stress UspA family protein